MQCKKIWVIVICAVFGVLLHVCALFAILKAAFPTLYYRVYPFSRIAGTVSVTVDGEPYPLKSGAITPVDSTILKKAHAGYQPSGSARIRIRGGEKASYGFLLHIDGVEQPIDIGTFHYNWWSVTQYTLTVSVDTSAETITFRCAAKVIGNDGKWIPVEDSETVPLSDPEIRFGFGLS